MKDTNGPTRVLGVGVVLKSNILELVDTSLPFATSATETIAGGASELIAIASGTTRVISAVAVKIVLKLTVLWLSATLSSFETSADATIAGDANELIDVAGGTTRVIGAVPVKIVLKLTILRLSAFSPFFETSADATIASDTTKHNGASKHIGSGFSLSTHIPSPPNSSF